MQRMYKSSRRLMLADYDPGEFMSATSRIGAQAPTCTASGALMSGHAVLWRCPEPLHRWSIHHVQGFLSLMYAVEGTMVGASLSFRVQMSCYSASRSCCAWIGSGCQRGKATPCMCAPSCSAAHTLWAWASPLAPPSPSHCPPWAPTSPQVPPCFAAGMHACMHATHP